MPITNDFDEFERKYKENNKGLFDIQNPLVCRNKYLENKIKVYEKNFGITFTFNRHNCLCG